MRTKDVDFDYGACLPIHSLPQSHPNTPQVNIAPPPPCKYDTPAHHNTTNNIRIAHNIQILFFVVSILQKLYPGPPFANRIQRKVL